MQKLGAWVCFYGGHSTGYKLGNHPKNIEPCAHRARTVRQRPHDAYERRVHDVVPFIGRKSDCPTTILQQHTWLVQGGTPPPPVHPPPPSHLASEQ